MDFAVRLSKGWVRVLRSTESCKGFHCGMPVIVIHSKRHRSAADLLDTYVHEALHASCPDLSEKEVQRVAGDITRVLWKAGYRSNG